METLFHYITVIPQNQFFFNFFLDDKEELHSKTLKEGEVFLQTFIPKQAWFQLNELLYSFIPFFIDIEKGELVELTIDREKELKLIKEEIKKETFQQNLKKEDKSVFSFDFFRQTDAILDKVSKKQKK